MATETDLVNAALRRVGGKRITDINDPVGSADIARDVIDQERDDLLRSHTWNFATTRELLAPLAEVPVFGFDHAFPLPTACLRMISVHNHDGTEETEYKLESVRQGSGDYIACILADDEALYVRYVRQVKDVGLMTVGFQSCLIAAMACVFAISVAKSNELYTKCASELDQTVRQAKSIDGIEDQIDQLREGSWVRARRGRWGSRWNPGWPR